MDSQVRMNAGGEYLLDRIKVALQDEKGVQVESLLTCLGALAGYACQFSVRQTGGTFAVVGTKDGTNYLYGDALNAPLAESPLSVWALISKAVQKLGAPLPDLAEIFKHVTETVGTSEFGVPRVADEHRSRDLPIVYLQQLWPQALPMAQKFCDKPAQLPVVFGIALHRALEQALGVLDTTLGARIAMESAVAMSKVILPEAAKPASAAAPKPRPNVVRSQPQGSSVAQQQREIAARLPPVQRMVVIAVVVLVAVGGSIWRYERNAERAAEHEKREQQVREWNESLRALERAAQQAQTAREQRKLEAPGEAPAQQAPATQALTPLIDDPNFETVRLPDGRVVTRLKKTN